jgi:hypothetical protein
MESSTELKCFKGLVYFYVVLLSVSLREIRVEFCDTLKLVGESQGFELNFANNCVIHSLP